MTGIVGSLLNMHAYVLCAALTCVVAVTVLAVAAPPFGLHFPMEPSTSWGLAEKIVFMGFAVGLELALPVD